MCMSTGLGQEVQSCRGLEVIDEPRNDYEREEHKLLHTLDEQLGTNYQAKKTVEAIVLLYRSRLDILHYELIALEDVTPCSP